MDHRKHAALVLFVLVLAILACDSEATQVMRTATPEAAVPVEATATAPPATATATALPELPGLGDTAERGGYTLTATAVEDPTTSGVLYTPVDGKKLVAVEIIVGNISGDEITANPLYATLVDADGFAYTSELGGRDGQIDTVELGPGEKAKGWVAFELPDGATPKSLKYETGLFGVILQVGLE